MPGTVRLRCVLTDWHADDFDLPFAIWRLRLAGVGYLQAAPRLEHQSLDVRSFGNKDGAEELQKFRISPLGLLPLLSYLTNVIVQSSALLPSSSASRGSALRGVW